MKIQVKLFAKQKYNQERGEQDNLTHESNIEEMIALEKDMNDFLANRNEIKNYGDVKKIYVALSNNLMMGLVEYVDHGGEDTY